MTKIQFILSYRLGIHFNHWWASMAQCLIVGPQPQYYGPHHGLPEDSWKSPETYNFESDEALRASEQAGYREWAREINEKSPLQWEQELWEVYKKNPEFFESEHLFSLAPPSDWGGIKFPEVKKGYAWHLTGSGTLEVEIHADGTTLFKGRQRKASPDTAPWWTLEYDPQGRLLFLREANTPCVGDDNWESQDGDYEKIEGGKYTWEVMTNAIKALGFVPPEVPQRIKPKNIYPVPNRRGSRSMAAIA